MDDWQRLKVTPGSRAYDIVIGEEMLARPAAFLRPFAKRARVAIITDGNVARLPFCRHLREGLEAGGIASEILSVPPGEGSKSMAEFARLLHALIAMRPERDDPIIALGGGVVGDLAGFVAASLLRGVPFIQIPTTLMAQVDSSIGGKTGINAPQGKNLIGAFHQPSLVLVDVGTLDTLPLRHILAGYAEIAKVALIGDATLFARLERIAPALRKGERQARREAIAAACAAKAAIVSRDEREHGVRALLNLGHTFGHALEQATGYGERLLHGEGVSIGIVMAFGLSRALGLCEGDEMARVVAHFQAMGMRHLPEHIPGPPPAAETLIAAMRQDKKRAKGKSAFILPCRIGEARIVRDVPEETLMRFLRRTLAASRPRASPL